MYHAYVAQSVQTMEKAISNSIGKEIASRRHGSPYKEPKHPKIVHKVADDMTQEERRQLKGDTLDLELLTRKNIGSNLSEIIVQLDQDGFIEKGRYILLPKLDSIFHRELKREDITAGYSFHVYDYPVVLVPDEIAFYYYFIHADDGRFQYEFYIFY